MQSPFISVVSPVYKAKEIVPELVRRIVASVSEITEDFEVILVEDGCPEHSWSAIEEACNHDPRIKGVKLSRNFGQHYAIRAGVDYAVGEYVIVMDCDLQDDPNAITALYQKAREGYEIVAARRMQREDRIFKRILSKLFFSFYSYWTETKIDGSIGNFAIYHRNVIDAYQKISERGQSLVLFSRWLGFSQTSILVKHRKRHKGKTSYNFSRLINLAIENIISQSNKPLRVSIKIGFTMTVLSFSYGVYLIARRFMFDVPIGWTSLMVAIFFVAGLLFANLGLLGMYLGKVYDETKGRPLYIIKSKIGWEKE